MSESIQCTGGADRGLIDARFIRTLNDRERVRLETHLSACAFCGERYRRMQLAERVASVGPDRALDEPSALEIDRVAQDIGLFDPPRRSILAARPWLLGVPAAAAALGLTLLVAVPRSSTQIEEAPVARGASAKQVSFAAYVVDAGSKIRALGGGRARQGEYLKLRVSVNGAAREALSDIQVSIVSDSGATSVTKLSVPHDASPIRNVNGAISLAAVPSGHAIVYTIGASGELEAGAIERSVQGAPAADAVAKTLGDRVLGVDRFELLVEP
jgi:hypothetical protein